MVNANSHFDVGRPIFWLAILLIPYDNIAIAPSAGWAAVSPYLFLIYALLNFPIIIDYGLRYFSSISPFVLLSLVVVFSLSILSILLNGLNFKVFLLDFAKIVLGLSFLFSFLVVEGEDKDFPKKLIKVLVIAYSSAVIIGFVQLASLRLGVNPFGGVFDLLFARYYANKVQFTFTEPSFAAIHAYGILGLFSYYLKCRGVSPHRLLILAVFIVFISIVSGSSLRVLFDGLLVFVVLFLFDSSSKNKIRMLVLFLLVLVVLFSTSNQLSERFSKFDLDGSTVQSSDPSAAIRAFRTQSAMVGWGDSGVEKFIGYGFSNSYIPMDRGIDSVVYQTPVVYKEMEDVALNPDGLIYSMHIKWLVEFGVVGYFLIVLSLFSRRLIAPFLICMISLIQFDSYAAYMIWLYILLCRESKGGDARERGVG